MLTDVVINHADLKKELEGLNYFKSIGPDSIHPKLLRSLTDDSSFIFALVKLFCVIIDTGKLPNMWKLANLTSLFKNGICLEQSLTAQCKQTRINSTRIQKQHIQRIM